MNGALKKSHPLSLESMWKKTKKTPPRDHSLPRSCLHKKNASGMKFQGNFVFLWGFFFWFRKQEELNIYTYIYTHICIAEVVQTVVEMKRGFLQQPLLNLTLICILTEPQAQGLLPCIHEFLASPGLGIPQHPTLTGTSLSLCKVPKTPKPFPCSCFPSFLWNAAPNSHAEQETLPAVMVRFCAPARFGVFRYF